MAKRRRKAKSGKWVGRLLSLLLAIPAAYLVAALIGSLVPVNRGWSEPEQGTTVYLIANDIHTDIVMPINAGGLDWGRLFPTRDFSAIPKRNPRRRATSTERICTRSSPRVAVA